MRLNQYVAKSTGLSRRAADKAIEQGRVGVNSQIAELGQAVSDNELITLDGRDISTSVKTQTIVINKPIGYVCSREGQGSKTIYDLLPKHLRHLKSVGRLDKDSSGLILLTNDGHLANQLTHPRYKKTKVYEVRIDRPLTEEDTAKITKTGIDIGDDTLSRFRLQKLGNRKQEIAENLIPNSYFQITMNEGRNRQIRRTFAKLGYRVTRLHRVSIASYSLLPIDGTSAAPIERPAPGGYQVIHLMAEPRHRQ